MSIPATTTLGRLMDTTVASLRALWRSRQERKRLLVRETAALGERRFVAVVQFEAKRFLIGYSATTVSLLSSLPDDDLTGDVSG